MNSLDLDIFKEKIKEGCIILDSRPATEFTTVFIPGSVSIGLGGQFEEWAELLISSKTGLIFIAPEGREEETAKKLFNAGIRNIEGYLEGGVETWLNGGEKIDMIIDIEADELAMDLPFDPNLKVVDVREYSEFSKGHVRDAINLPLDEMADLAQIASLEDDQNLYVHCSDGYRSVTAASLLKREGYHSVRNILGGWEKIKEEKNIPQEIENESDKENEQSTEV